MCGRFTLSSPWKTVAKLLSAEPVDDAEWGPAYNICPTDPAGIVRVGPSGTTEAALFKWGLVPWWAKDPKVGVRFINARSETVATTNAFRDAFRRARCLVPASGFYEWKKDPAAPKKKQPHWIHPAEADLFTFAGLWAEWREPTTKQPLLTFTILTTAANADMAPLHDRMPVVLDAADRERWLDPKSDPDGLQALLTPWRGRLAHHPVGPGVGDVRADGPELIAPIAAPEPPPGPPKNLELDL
ncbi:MAG: SOS response-associated peptidase [Deltaproteobacteria bacterium]|nr:MAG: SOS response-associated peptidase [Deltaproteobacteria bacterium]